MEPPTTQSIYPPPPYDAAGLIQQPVPTTTDATPMMMEKGELHAQQKAADAPAVRHQRAERNLVRDLITLVFCFLIPPIAVVLANGPHMKMHILLSVVLCVIGWVPGILHAMWYCFFYVRKI